MPEPCKTCHYFISFRADCRDDRSEPTPLEAKDATSTIIGEVIDMSKLFSLFSLPLSYRPPVLKYPCHTCKYFISYDKFFHDENEPEYELADDQGYCEHPDNERDAAELGEGCDKHKESLMVGNAHE